MHSKYHEYQNHLIYDEILYSHFLNIQMIHSPYLNPDSMLFSYPYHSKLRFNRIYDNFFHLDLLKLF